MEDPLFHRWELRQQRAADGGPLSLPAQWSEMVRRLQDRITRWLDDLFRRSARDSLRPSESTGMMPSLLRLMGWVIGIVTLAFIAYAIVRIVRERRDLASQAVVSRQQIRDALAAGDALSTDAGGWLREAGRLAEEDDIRLAYRALYLALLSGLHSRHLIDFRRNRTNWVYVRQFRGTDGQRADFTELTGMFDDVWYGLKPAAVRSLGSVNQRIGRLVEAGGADA